MIKNIQAKIGLVLISLSCVLYYIFLNRFAEINIQLAFLDFPIFVGEMLLGICIVLSLWKIIVCRQFVFNKWTVLLSIYVSYVLLMAFTGYGRWSSLAFRHAAMFYYPLFAVIVYLFLNLIRFHPKRLAWTYLIWVTLFFLGHTYGVYTYFILALIAALSIKSVKLKYVLVLGVFLSIPYNNFIYTARMMIVANFTAFSCVACLLIFMIPISLRKKMAVLSLAVLGLCVVFSMNWKSISTIVNIKQLFEIYQSYDQKIKNRKNFTLADRRFIQLYNPNLKGVKKESIRKRTVHTKDLAQTVKEKKIEGVYLKYVKVPMTKLYVHLKSFFDRELEWGKAKETRPTKVVAKEADRGVEQVKPKVASSIAVEVKDISQVVEQVKPKVASSIAVEVKDIPQVVEQVKPKVASPVAMEVVVEQVKSKIASPVAVEVKDTPPAKKQKDRTHWEELNKETDRVIDRMKKVYSGRSVKKNAHNGIFRILIWKDLIEEIITERAVFGFGFGKPTRSKSLEALNWGSGEWKRDGWVAVHNSFLHIIYRTGIIGVLLLSMLFGYFIKVVMAFLKQRDVVGILLCSVIINWWVAANFLLILELPQMAIPLWTIIGFTYYYYRVSQRQDMSHALEK